MSYSRGKKSVLALATLLGLSAIAGRASEEPSQGTEAQRVQPILARCLACHDGATPAGGLGLAQREGALKGGKTGAALVPNDPEKSLLFQRVVAKQMPPGQPLTVDEIETVRRWIAAGAPWLRAPAGLPRRAGLDWWSLRKPERPHLPKVRNAAWVRNPIDAFVLAELERHKLTPAPPADRTTLIRRVTYDLLGVPPTPQEIDAFLHNPAANAYEKLVDRLLADPRYGERWGRHWLDVARYGESNGFEQDVIRDNAWRYRDYVIDSFNADKPYAQFVREQLAGDALQPVTSEGIVATGFLVAGPWDQVGNQVDASATERLQTREEEMEDTLSAVSQTFLGLTVNCARCHDHKFDPIPQRDYYRLKAVFDGVYHGDRPMRTPEETRALNAHLADLRQQLETKNAALLAIERAGRERVRAADGGKLVA